MLRWGVSAPKYQSESSRLVRGDVVWCGLSPRSSLPDVVSREVRVSPLQRLSAGLTGIQVVPRIHFALKAMDFGAFFFSVLKIKLKQKGE